MKKILRVSYNTEAIFLRRINKFLGEVKIGDSRIDFLVDGIPLEVKGAH